MESSDWGGDAEMAARYRLGMNMHPRYEPIDDPETVEREMKRTDGIIRVRLRPFHQRFWNSYEGFRLTGMSMTAALRGAWFMARI